MSPESQKASVLVICGPTASGKSSLGVALAEALNGEIINADSIQVYRGFRIGAGAPPDEDLVRAPHHLIGTLSPNQEWNAGSFCEQATDIITEVRRRNKLPIVVGGTGLYIRALLGGLVEVEVTTEAKSTLAHQEEELRRTGLGKEEINQHLHRWLSTLDPETASSLNPSDSQRLRRALLVVLSSGESLHQLHTAHAHQEIRFNALVLCLLPEREQLYRNIDLRVEEMIAHGFLGEVAELLRSYSAEIKPLQSIGYKQAVAHLQGLLSLEEMRSSMAQETRRFAKRQLTWWKHQPGKLSWKILEAANYKGATEFAGNFHENSGLASRLAELLPHINGISFLPLNVTEQSHQSH